MSAAAMQCSTPGGVIGIGTRWRSLRMLLVDVLNAWRRHWNRHLVQRRGMHRRPARAQRLAASLESAQSVRCSTSRCGVYVLNAWRRHWNRHTRPASAALCELCSTPGGVIGIGTRISDVVPPTSLRVLNAWRRHWNRHVQAVIAPSMRGRVLNAWRRHWNRHRGRRRLHNARHMVLNAWRRHWNRHRSAPDTSSELATVLNAWRRHWNRHAIRSGPSARISHVLNAWRRHWNRHAAVDRRMLTIRSAQRLAASLESAPSDRRRHRGPRWCSTPGGVIGIGTWRSRRASRPLGWVLNAWRRHWNRHHAIAESRTVQSNECSTPGGVIGIGTSTALGID